MTSPVSILLAISDPVLRRGVAGHLRAVAGLAVDEAASRDDVLDRAAGHRLAVVDEALDGPALCAELKSRGLSLPVLLLGGAGAPPCCGVEAVVAKPLRLPLLAARIQDILARQANGHGVAVGPWRFDEQRSVLNGEGGALVRLTAKETAILRRLHEAAGGVVSRQTLLDEVWGYGAEIDTHTLETHVYRLRRKLGAGVLVSDNGGYRLAGS